MTSDLSAAMRRATELTRAFNLTEATKVIQTALSGRQHAPAAQGFRGKRLETQVEAETMPRTRRQRILRPLGEVVETLKEARARLLDAPRAKRPVVTVPDGAQFLTRTFACEAGTRQYRLFVPAAATEPPRGLVVMLHGCQQNPDDFAVGTKMNEVACLNNLVVAYPSQPTTANAAGCWNWFAPAHQMRDRGEPAILAGLTRKLMHDYGFDRAQVLVAGLSAGGAMAAVMLETYPELFSGAGIHSGLAYRSASDVMSAFSAMRGDATHGGSVVLAKQPYAVRTIIFHGDADTTVHPGNARRIIAGLVAQDWQVTQDRGEANGLAFSREIYSRNEDRVELWSIAGAGHAWSGGDPNGSFANRAGPNASAEIVRFFFS
jgi:poly(hydroxyalkanoate) depolymerase family esterase